MKPLLVLLLTFGVALAGTTFIWQQADDMSNIILAGRLGMAAMLLFTAIGHFAFTPGMALMLPGWLPAKKFWVWATGVFELLAAGGLLLPAFQMETALVLAAFFVLVLPANIIAAIKHVDYQRATLDGPGPRYLWFRVPLQLFFIAWTLYFCFALPLFYFFVDTTHSFITTITALWPF